MPDAADQQQATDLISSISYFSEVDQATLEAIAEFAVYRTYDADQTIFLEGEPSAGLFIVQRGAVTSVKLSPEGREQVMRVVGPGEVFNAIGVLARSTNPGSVVALEATALWILPRVDLLRILDEHPSLASMVIQALAERNQHLMKQVEDLSLRTVEARLAGMLLAQASENTIQRASWDTQAEMAARLGTVPDVLNRALRRFSEDGLIEVERQLIKILDRERLAARADLGK